MAVRGNKGEHGGVTEQLVQLLETPEELRRSEDVFEIANSLGRASFIRQLDVGTRSAIARCAVMHELVPGAHVYLCEKGENALYIVLSGSVKIEAAGLEFQAGDTFGHRPNTCPTFQVMVDHLVVTCARGGVAAKVPFEDCRKIWPNSAIQDSEGRQAPPPPATESAFDLVWSPELAKSILLRGSANAEEIPVALEFFNFPPINGYSKELREILVSQFIMLRQKKGGVFREWNNHLPVDPRNIQLFRVHCYSVVIVVSGSLKVTCRRRREVAVLKASPGTGDVASQSANSAGDGRAEDGAEGEQDGGAEEFVLMRLKRGDVFPPHSGQMQGGRLRKDDADFDKEAEETWADFTLCALVADSPSVEVLLVDAHIFNDVIYPGADLRYSMENVRSILGKPPGERTSREISYIARNVLSHHVAFQQMPLLTLERIASRLSDMVGIRGGETLVAHEESVTGSLLLLTGSASIVSSSKERGRSMVRRMKVGRLEPGDLWGFQHMQTGAEAKFEILAVESCEVVRCPLKLVRAAEKRDCVDRCVSARAMRSLRVPPELRKRWDVRNIVAEMSTPKSALDVAGFRDIPASLKTRIAAALRLEVWPPFREVLRDDESASQYFVIVKGSISLQAVPKSQRFAMEPLDVPENSPLKNLDVDNGLALEEWKASGLGPCAAILCERQVLGEYPNSEKAVPRVRAVTRQETTAVVVDAELYDKHLSRFHPGDAQAALCRKVLAHLKMLPDSQAGVGGLDSDLLLSLLGANRVLKKLKTTCRLRLSGAISLKRYSAGEVVTEEEDFGNNLYIILEGCLKFSVQDNHRGVIDRELAREAGIVPGLRCIGVMTSGDFFAPDSMMGSDRRPRVVRAGSYRVRCSQDGSMSGAMCLILPRQKLEDAVRRDQFIKSAFAHEEILRMAGIPSVTPPRCQSPASLPKVDFGGPASPSVVEAAEEKEERKGEGVKATSTLAPPSAIGEAEDTEAKVSRIPGPTLATAMTATARVSSQPQQDQELSHDPGGGSEGPISVSGLSQSPTESGRRVPATATAATSIIADTASGVQTRGYSETSETSGSTGREARSSAVPVGDSTEVGREKPFMTGVPLMAGPGFASGDVGKSSSVPPSTATTGSIVACRDLSTEQASSIGGKDDGSSSLSVAQYSLVAYADLFNSRKFLEVSGETSSVAQESLKYGNEWDAGEHGIQDLRMRQFPCSTFSGGLADMGAGGVRGGAGTVGKCGNLLDVLRSFVSLHVDHQKKLCGPNVLPRKGFSGRLATDELTLLGMLSELSKAPGRDDRQDACQDGKRVLQPTPLCCRSILPPPTFGGGSGAQTLSSVRQAIARDARGARAAMAERAALPDAEKVPVDRDERQQAYSPRGGSSPTFGGYTRRSGRDTTATEASVGHVCREPRDSGSARCRQKRRRDRDQHTMGVGERSLADDTRLQSRSVRQADSKGAMAISSHGRELRGDVDGTPRKIPQQPPTLRPGKRTPRRTTAAERHNPGPDPAVDFGGDWGAEGAADTFAGVGNTNATTNTMEGSNVDSAGSRNNPGVSVNEPQGNATRLSGETGGHNAGGGQRIGRVDGAQQSLPRTSGADTHGGKAYLAVDRADCDSALVAEPPSSSYRFPGRRDTAKQILVISPSSPEENKGRLQEDLEPSGEGENDAMRFKTGEDGAAVVRLSVTGRPRVSPRKQPAMVRRLKITLQEFNDLSQP